MSQIEYAIAGNTQTKVSMGDGETVVETTDTNGYEQEVESGVSQRRESASEDADGGDIDTHDPDEDVDGAGASEDDGDGADVSTEAPEVPEAFDAEDPENVAAFEAVYLTVDGELNEDIISEEFWRNKDGGAEGLNEATYEFLKTRGISKAFAKKVEAAFVNQHDAAEKSLAAHDLKVMDAADGPDNLKAMLEWGKSSGYTEAQRDRFNKIMQGTDLDAKLEAIELLRGRFEKSDAAKPTTPKRDATKGNGKPRPGAQPFKTRSEWREARRKAEGDISALRLIDARAKASGY